MGLEQMTETSVAMLYVRVCVCVYVYIYICIYIYIYIQGVPGGMCQTLGECSLS